MIEFFLDDRSLNDDKEIKELAVKYYLARDNLLRCLEQKTQIRVLSASQEQKSEE